MPKDILICLENLQKRVDELAATNAVQTALLNFAIGKLEISSDDILFIEHALEATRSALICSDSSDAKIDAFNNYANSYLKIIKREQ